MDTPLGQVRDGELVVDKGAEFSLTCRSDSKIDWAYGEYKPHEGEVSTWIFIRNRLAQGWAMRVDFIAFNTILG